MNTREARKSLWTWGIVGGAVRDSLIKLNPRTLMKNPVMFVVEIGAVITTFDLVRDRIAAPERLRLRAADHALAVVHGALCQLRRSHGRRPRQGAGRHAAQGARGNHGAPHQERRHARRGARLEAARRRPGQGRRGRIHSRATAKSSKASPRSTNPPSPANPRP